MTEDEQEKRIKEFTLQFEDVSELRDIISGIELRDKFLASIAISLKRLADTQEELLIHKQSNGV